SGVLIMGLSYGQTVLASDLPANREIIQNGVNGWLFEAGNPDDLALNILRLKNRAKKPTFESIIQTLKNQHSWENMALNIRPYVQ
ncbi:MAG: glycosyltransferase, partial [Bacteroidota bacterium]